MERSSVVGKKSACKTAVGHWLSKLRVLAEHCTVRPIIMARCTGVETRAKQPQGDVINLALIIVFEFMNDGASHPSGVRYWMKILAS